MAELQDPAYLVESLPVCSKCGASKPLDQFYRDNSRTSGRKSSCIPCEKARVAHQRATDPEAKARQNQATLNWYYRNQERVAERRRKDRGENPEKYRNRKRTWEKENPDKVRSARLRKMYGITLDDYHQMLEAQDGRCGICGSMEPGGPWGTFAVDHCHRTGVVRGLLCSPCNMGLGQLGDDPAVLRNAVTYLERHL